MAQVVFSGITSLFQLLTIFSVVLFFYFIIKALQFMRFKTYHDEKLIERLEQLIDLQKNKNTN